MPRAMPVVRRVTGKMNRDTIEGRVVKHMPFRHFTAEVKKIIIDCVRKGEYGTSAARQARISERTLAHWLAIGEAALKRQEDGEDPEPNDEEFAKFYLDVYEAEGKDESQLVGVVRDAAVNDGNWVAGMTLLERRHGRRWRKTETTQIVGAGGGPVQIEIDNGPEKIAEVLDVLRAAGVLPEGIKGLPEHSTVEAEAASG